MPMYGAELNLNAKMEAVMEDFGHEVANQRRRVICKCKNKEEAEKLFKKVALVGRWDIPDCCVEIQDESGVKVLRDTDLAVCISGDNYLTHDDIREALLR